MKKCKLCGRELSGSYKGNVCRECRGKVGSFAKKSAAGVIAAAGAIAAIKSSEAGKKIPFIEEIKSVGKVGAGFLDKADSFIDEHSLGAKELLDKSIDAAEYRMKGLPGSFAGIDKLKSRIKSMDDFDEEYEETSDQIADLNRR